MKIAKTLFTAAAIAAIITASAPCALAQVTNLITLDENGNGFFNGIRLTYTVDPDPINHVPTLHYFLPFSGFTNRLGMLC